MAALVRAVAGRCHAVRAVTMPRMTAVVRAWAGAAGSRVGGQSSLAASTDTSSSAVFFDRGVKRAHLDRAAQAALTAAEAGGDGNQYDYIYDEVARRVLDRLNDVKRDFPVVVEVGSGHGAFARYWNGEGNIRKLFMIDGSAGALERSRRDVGDVKVSEAGDSMQIVRMVREEESSLPFGTGEVDAVLSLHSLHWINDLPAVLAEARRVLKPDGVFLGAMIGEPSLYELRSALVVAETEREGGVSARISPMATVGDVGNLISAAGFGIPTVDVDELVVEYPDAATVMEHVGGMGGSNASLIRRPTMARDTLLAAAAAYHGMYGKEADGSVPATFHIIHMIGWQPAPTQPKPLSRGSVPKGFAARPHTAVADAAASHSTPEQQEP